MEKQNRQEEKMRSRWIEGKQLYIGCKARTIGSFGTEQSVKIFLKIGFFSILSLNLVRASPYGFIQSGTLGRKWDSIGNKNESKFIP